MVFGTPPLMFQRNISFVVRRSLSEVSLLASGASKSCHKLDPINNSNNDAKPKRLTIRCSIPQWNVYLAKDTMVTTTMTKTMMIMIEGEIKPGVCFCEFGFVCECECNCVVVWMWIACVICVLSVWKLDTCLCVFFEVCLRVKDEARVESRMEGKKRRMNEEHNHHHHHHNHRWRWRR